MDPDKRQEELAAKWLNCTITPAEKMEFSAWYNAHKGDHVELPESFSGDEEALKARILANVRKGMVKRLRLRRAVTIAAAMVLVGSIGLLLWQMQTDEHGERSVAVQQDVQPGGNRATLTLTDGRIIDLSSDKDGIIIGDGITYEDGSLVATTQESLELATPKGGQYQLTLPDGTKVWLNSATLLKYPATFNKERRVVELVAGEAYFEVSSQPATDGTGGKRPFVVKTNQQEVEVLGTQFNINAYSDGEGVKTTLVEGSVSVRSNDAHRQAASNGKESPGAEHAMILKPGEQAVTTDKGILINKVDAEEFTAWKDGYFYFNGATIRDVMKQFSRWYDVEIQYDSLTEKEEDVFVGKIPKAVSLATAVQVLKGTGTHIDFREQQRLVIIKDAAAD